MQRLLHRALLLLALLFHLSSHAEDGYVFGHDHCFHFNAPQGWTLDNVSGRSQGVAMVFYPRGGTWASSPTIMYARVASLAVGGKTDKEKIQGQVDATLKDFRANGSGPNFAASFSESLTARSGAAGELWRYGGDQFGNQELVAYFVGKKSVNFFVMSSRDAGDFERAKSAIVELAESYREASNCAPCDSKGASSSCIATKPAVDMPASGNSVFSKRVAYADELESKPGVLDYFRKSVYPAIGDKMSAIMRECTALPNAITTTFIVLIDFSNQGRLQNIAVEPATNTALCFAKAMVKMEAPPPPVGLPQPLTLGIKMQISL